MPMGMCAAHTHPPGPPAQRVGDVLPFSHACVLCGARLRPARADTVLVFTDKEGHVLTSQKKGER